MSIISYREVVTNANSWTKKFSKASRIVFVHVDYTSDGTAGNRQIRLAIVDPDGNDRFDAHAGAVQAASLTRHYSFSQGVYRETAFVDEQIQTPIPMGIIVPSGYTLKIYDNTGVSASDDFVVSYQVEEGF